MERRASRVPYTPSNGIGQTLSVGFRPLPDSTPKGSLGVSRLDGREDEIRHFLNLGVSKSSIAKITGVTRPTLYNFIATRGRAMVESGVRMS